MLSKDYRQVLLDYISEHASDWVLLECHQTAKREYEEAYVTVTNILLTEKKRIKAVANTGGILTTSSTTDGVTTTDTIELKEDIIPLIPDTELPNKFGSTGKSCVDVLKRKSSPMTLADIAKVAGKSITLIKPQVALGVKRNLIKQIRTDLFEVK